ncbi:Os01g0879000, partial [Oryza sativa Japonica Group]
PYPLVPLPPSRCTLLLTPHRRRRQLRRRFSGDGARWLQQRLVAATVTKRERTSVLKRQRAAATVTEGKCAVAHGPSASLLYPSSLLSPLPPASLLSPPPPASLHSPLLSGEGGGGARKEVRQWRGEGSGGGSRQRDADLAPASLGRVDPPPPVLGRGTGGGASGGARRHRRVGGAVGSRAGAGERIRCRPSTPSLGSNESILTS